MDDRNQTAVFYASANSRTVALPVPGNDLQFYSGFRLKKMLYMGNRSIFSKAPVVQQVGYSLIEGIFRKE